ncbi:MAG: hypothetical protein ABIT09_03485 [Croceibacterium sp.]
MNAAIVRDLPLPQRLALTYAPARAWPLAAGLLALDARLGEIVRGRREPIASQLRLAWWRDLLAEAPSQWPLGEPLLEALRAWRNPAPLAALADGWEGLLGDLLTADAVADFVLARGLAWRALANELELPCEDEAARGGQLWAAADLAANLSDPAERALAIGQADGVPRPAPLPRELRTLAVLASLGRAALARGGAPLLGGPASVLIALRTGLTGR